MQLGAFDPTKKKKKKKFVINDLADDSFDQLAEKTERLAGNQNLGFKVSESCIDLHIYACVNIYLDSNKGYISNAVSDGVEPTFTGLKKKKKKQVGTLVFHYVLKNLVWQKLWVKKRIKAFNFF